MRPDGLCHRVPPASSIFVEYAIKEVQEIQEWLELKVTHKNSVYTVDVHPLIKRQHNRLAQRRLYWQR